MEIEIINDILTQTVDKYILGVTHDIKGEFGGPSAIDKTDRMARLSQSSLVSHGSTTNNRDSMNTSKGSISSIGSSTMNVSNTQDNEKKLLENCSLNEWLSTNAPILLERSLKKLGMTVQSIATVDLKQNSERELAERKKKAKSELKVYDSSFEHSFRRFPNREEKEPMRPLYIYYKKLKEAMDARGGTTAPVDNTYENMVDELVQVKNQRNELRTKLENYQLEFIKNHNRKIKFRQDIIDVEDDYNLYKKLKDDIAALEDKIKNFK